ncbi:MAG: tetratricopeptide repeat protein [Candidatus Omnitrophica bacterium]|nr:tetratricopeptide repeat protein [Candidatus Omnitrophota bacterium]
MKRFIFLLAAIFMVNIFYSGNICANEALDDDILLLKVAEKGSSEERELREEIIAFVLTLKKPPSIPKEAIRFEGRAESAVNLANTKSDYLDAAAEYEKALKIAPWVARYYYNAGLVYEKAEEYSDAINALKLYLLAAPNAEDAMDIEKKIAGLEYAIEKKRLEEIYAPTVRIDDYEAEPEKPWTEKLNGRWLGGRNEATFDGVTWYSPDTVYEIELIGDQIEMRIVEFGVINRNYQETRSPQNYLYFSGRIDGNRAKGRSYPWQHSGGVNGRLTVTVPYDITMTVALSDDGDTLYWGDLELKRER